MHTYTWLKMYMWYRTVKNFGGKTALVHYSHSDFTKIVDNFHNFNSISYDFTIACCPSKLVRLLGLPLLMS